MATAVPLTVHAWWASLAQKIHDHTDREILKLFMQTHDFSIKDSGKRQDFITGSRRDTDVGKGRPDLIPTILLKRLALHFELGALKYGDANWTKGQPLSRYYSSAFRHLLKVRDGMEDEDHLTAAIWNLQAIMWTLEEIREGRLPIGLCDLPYCTAPSRVVDPVLDGGPERLQKVAPIVTSGDQNGVPVPPRGSLQTVGTYAQMPTFGAELSRALDGS